MRLRIADSGVAGLLVLPTLVAAVNFDCSYVQVNKHKYDFSKLGGDHAVHWTRDEPPSVMDTVFSLNICKNLARNRDLPKAEQCTTGTRSKFNDTGLRFIDRWLIEFLQYARWNMRTTQSKTRTR